MSGNYYDPNEEYEGNEEEEVDLGSNYSPNGQSSLKNIRKKIGKNLSNPNLNIHHGNIIGSNSGLKNVAGDGARKATEEGSKKVAKEGVKTAAQAGTKAATKAGTKAAAKAGATVAAEAGASATGVGAIGVAALEAAKHVVNKLKKIKNDRNEEEKRKKRRKVIILIIVLSIFMFLVIGSSQFIVNETTTTNLEEIINKREKRNTDIVKKNVDASSLAKKSLMMFTDEEYKDLVVNDYDEIEGSRPKAYNDPSYKTYLKSEKGSSINNFFNMQEDIEEKDEFEISANVVKDIIKCEKDNFNKIKWKAVKSSSAYTIPPDKTYNTLSEMQNDDISIYKNGIGDIDEIKNLKKVPYTELKIPDLSKYNTDPTSTNETEKAFSLVQAVEPYIQKWFIPYTMMIDTNNKKFIQDEVIGNMYHPIEFTLYEINREEKKITTEYYLECEVSYKWDEVYFETSSYIYDPNSPGGKGLPLGKNKKNVKGSGKQVIRSSNTKLDPIGEKKSEDRRQNKRTWVDNSDTVPGGKVLKEEFLVTKNYRQCVELTGGGIIAKDKNGEMIKSIKVSRKIYPYKYVPKITNAETFYEVIKANFEVSAIDESSPAKEVISGNLTLDSKSNVGTKTITEYRDENLNSSNYESKPYQVSYYSESDVKKLGRKISRVEWMQDWGNTKELKEAIKNGSMSGGGYGNGAPTSENMTRLLEKAEEMAKIQRWTYSMKYERTIVNTEEGINSKSYFDCSSFISSLYRTYLNVNPGSTTIDMFDRAKSGNNNFEVFELDSIRGSLRLGDILYRPSSPSNSFRHVGLYVGNDMQIDAGYGKVPKKQKVDPAYRYVIRYNGDGFEDIKAPDNAGEQNNSSKEELSDKKGIIYPYKTFEERKEAYDKYHEKGYSYDDMYFAYNQIEKRLAKINKNGHGKNDLSESFKWPAKISDENPGTNVINAFYGRTPAYLDEFHYGLDISRGNVNYNEGGLTKGELVVAAHDGTVVQRSANPVSNADNYTYVNIKTKDGTYTTQYGHLSEINVNKGDEIKKGDVVGRMGTTGNSTGVHLHFAVTDSTGQFMDPLTFYNIAKESEPDTIVNLDDINRSSLVNIPSGYIYHSEKAGGTTKLREYIRGWEYSGTPPMNNAKTKYKVYDDGYGHPTVGYGIDIKNSGFENVFLEAGYSTSIGSEIDIEFVDAIEETEIDIKKQAVMDIVGGLNLQEFQIHALVSRAFNCGVSGALGVRDSGIDFKEAYIKYWKSSDLMMDSSDANYNHPLYLNYMNKPNTSSGIFSRGLEKRRKKEWMLFQTGIYDNKY